MAYDPTKPANNAPIVSSELRDQFAGLKTLIDAKVATADLTAAIEADSAGPIPGISYLSLSVSNPPTQAEVQAIADKVDELIAALSRT
jgi:hypothetical protein